MRPASCITAPAISVEVVEAINSQPVVWVTHGIGTTAACPLTGVANEYEIITGPIIYLPQHKNNYYEGYRERRNVDVYIYSSIDHVDLIPHDSIDRRAGGVYEMT